MVNTGEIINFPDSIDNDGNGKVDDIFGWDFFDDDPLVFDENGHGTLVASIIGGIVNNSIGGAGVAPRAKIMALRVGNDFGSITIAAMIDASLYAANMGARIINYSAGGTQTSSSVQSLMTFLDQQGILFVVAAGNGGVDGFGDNNDSTPYFPASYTNMNILSVAAQDRTGGLSYFSNYGAVSVDLAAPGTDIYGADIDRSFTFFESFESSVAGWTQGHLPGSSTFFNWTTYQDIFGRTWVTDSDYLGTPFNYDPFTNSWLESPPIATGALGTQLLYRIHYQLEFFTDYLVVEVTNNSGLTWNIVDSVTWSSFTNCPSCSLNAGTVKSVDLSDYDNQSINVRFRLVSDGSFQYDGAYIDDIAITNVILFSYSDKYDYNSGTSFSAPLVSGVAALIMSQRPDLTHHQVRQLILDNVTNRSGLSGKVATGGELNAYKTLQAAIALPTSNNAPVISGTPATSVAQDSAYSFTPTSSDVDSDTLLFSITNKPTWASFNTATGELSGTPTNGDVGTTNGIVITVDDQQSQPNSTASLASFDLEVTNVNDAPTIGGVPATSVTQDSAYSFTPTSGDIDSDTLLFSVTNKPTWASFNTTTGELSGTPANADVGTTNGIVITVDDQQSQPNSTASLASFDLEVTNVNDAPTIGGTPPTSVAQDVAYSFTPTSGDVDGDTLLFSITNKPTWASFNTATGELSGTPANADVGTTTGIVITVDDQQSQPNSAASLASFDLEVTDVNNAPTIGGAPATSVAQDVAYSFTPTSGDIDGDTLLFSITNKPTWASFNTATGELSGTPTNADIGTTTGIVITVDDQQGQPNSTTSLASFDLEVTNVNDAPTISGTPATSVVQDVGYSFTPTSGDIDGDTLLFSITNKPTWASFNTATGELSGTPANADVGTTTGIVITVDDQQSQPNSTTSLASFDLEVTDVNDAPTISGSPATTVPEDSAYSFIPTSGDVDGDILLFSIVNKPTWASFNTATGELSGTPTNADVDTTTGIVITVDDQQSQPNSTTRLASFDLEVTNVNDAPTIGGTPATSVAQDAGYSFTPTSGDVDGDILLFSIVNKPTWASFNTATGELSGTPANVDVGTTTGIVVTVDDQQSGLNSTANLAAFDLEVTDVNDAPTISGTPATSVAQDAGYSFTPTSGDIDGDTLLFGITNKPGWASFNTATGELSGTPTNADVGATTGIVITVDDQQSQPNSTTSLASFDLEVTDVNDAPTIGGTPATSVAQDAGYSFTPTSGDIDGDTLLFSITNKPTWASFNTATGELSGTPANADVGTTTGIVITVDDQQSQPNSTANLASFDLEVTNVNDAPTIGGTPNTTVAQGDSYSFTPTTGDIDSDTLLFSVTNKPGWASFNTATGELSGTPTNADVGATTGIVITVDDQQSQPNSTTSLASFDLEVTDVNDAPTIGGTPATSVAQDVGYSFTPTSGDIDGDTLLFSITNKPTWASFNTATGELSGTPANADVGTTTGIVITVDDQQSQPNSTANLASFDLEVTNVNDAPTIGGTPNTTVAQGDSYSFTPTTGDIDSDTLLFSVTNKPGWASFNTATGELSGTPTNADVGTTTGIVITVDDQQSQPNSTASLATFNLEVTDVNDAPTISGSPATTAPEDSAYSFIPTAGDVDGDTLLFSITNKPAWASFNTATGELSGTPANADVGTITTGIVITVDDQQAQPNSTTGLASFDLEVTNVNDAPTISGTPAASVAQDSAYSFTPTSGDIDGDTLLFSITNKPTWASFNTATGELSGTPANADVGTTTGIVITVDDQQSQPNSTASLATFNLEVTDVNDVPTISGTPATTATEDSPYSFTPTSGDIDGDTLLFGITNKPAWASFNTATGELSGTPANADVGIITTGIVITVDDQQAQPNSTASLVAFDLEVLDVNDAPTISGTPAASVAQDSAYSFTPTSGDIDGDTLLFSVTNKPTWASFNTATGELSGAPTNADVGTTTGIMITVDDQRGELNSTASLASFDLEVTNVNDAPTIGGTPATSVAQDVAYSFTPTSGDIDGDTLLFGITNKPTWASFNTATGELTGTPTNADIGTTTGIVITVDDQQSQLNSTASLASFDLEVADVNDAPTISGSPATTVPEDSAYSFTPTSGDIDGDTLLFNITNKPTWASFNTTTGELSGTPANADVGTTTGIVITVDDQQSQPNSTASLASFDLEVTNVNDAPTISGTPATSVAQDVAYSFTPTSGDIDGDTLLFSITNKPTWASFNTATGELSGTPTNADVGTTTGIVITVDDQQSQPNSTASLASFDLEVTDVNDAPTISGSPATTVPEDSAYSFIPTSGDVDGDILLFSIVNKPTWASFNTATGELSGTPTNADVGTTTGIVITVDDQQSQPNSTTSLASFDLEVTDVNDAPTISGAPSTIATEDSPYSFIPTSGDVDGDTLLFSITNKPTWASFNTATGELSGTPTNADVGTTTGIVITVDDQQSQPNSTANLASFDLEVTNVNDAPTISGSPATTAIEDSAYSFIPTAGDVDGDTLLFSIINKPTWASFNTVTGELSGTPTSANVGTTDGIVIMVDDQLSQPNSTASLASFDLAVMAVNDSPTISVIPSQTIDEDTSTGDLTFTIIDEETAASALIVSASTNNQTLISNANLVLGGSGTSRTINVTPEQDQNGGPVTVTVTVSDGFESTSTTFFVTIDPTNDAPVAGNDGASVIEYGSVNINVAGNDTDIDSALDFTSINIIDFPLNGSVSANADGTVDYVETMRDATSDNFTYTIKDTNGAISNVATVSITIIPAPDSNGDGISDPDAISIGLDPNDPDGDTDGDGISDVVEVGGDLDNPLDTDGDGLIDALEPASDAADAGTANGLPLTDGVTTSITTATGETLSSVSSSETTGGPSGIDFSFGAISYTTTAPLGGSVVVRMEFSEDLPASLVIYKVDGATYTELPSTIWVLIDPRTIDITLTDGDPLTDLDGVINGSIDDPIAPGGQVPTVAISGGGGGGGGFGCALSANTGIDPIFPLMMFASMGYSYRRRKRVKKSLPDFCRNQSCTVMHSTANCNGRVRQ